MEVATYEHDLGNGSALTAYSIDPKIGREDLETCVKDSLLETKGKAPVDMAGLKRSISCLGHYEDFSGLQLQPSFDKYNMPKQLHAHRDAIELGFSDSIIIYRDGKVDVPGEVIKGEYRDFASTHLKKVPSTKAPGKYEEGKTIAELLPEWGLSSNDVAKYLGFAHFMSPSDGGEVSFVYRGKNLHIAPDCMALSGSTPKFPEHFNQSGFSMDSYFKSHIAEEMEEEYCLNPEEFDIGSVTLMNDIEEIPFALVEINVPLSTRKLAEKAYGQPQPMKEHGIFFGTDRNGLDEVIKQFDIFPSTARIMDMLREH